MIIVSDASPIIFLAKIRQLELLGKLYREKITVPAAVKFEILSPDHYPEVEIYISEFFEKCNIVNYRKSGNFSTNSLSHTDIIVLTYAVENKADIIISDDKLVRRVASSKNLNLIGTLGVLIKALKKSILTKKQIKQLVDDLINTHHFRISIEVYNQVMEVIEIT